jgi:hypothetical protein
MKPEDHCMANRISFALALVALMAMITSAPRLAAQDSAGPQATETRTAEETEIASLRSTVAALETEIAVLTMPTATATLAPTATIVPARPAESPEPIGDSWLVTVGSLSTSPTWENEVADGSFARVELVITNLGETPKKFPFDQFVLRDASGRVFVPDKGVGFDLGAGWITRFDPNIPTEAFIIFDIATDATGPFVLEFQDDPTFRIEVREAIRG